MLSEKEFYLYVEKNILKYLPEMEDQKVMVQRVKKNNQVSIIDRRAEELSASSIIS